MTEQQYKRFNGLIDSLNSLSEKQQNKFKSQLMLVSISDTKRAELKIKLKKWKGEGNRQYIRHVLISGLKTLEADGKQLYFDDKCNLSIRFENKTLRQPKKKIVKKTVKKFQKNSVKKPFQKNFNKNFNNKKRVY